MPTDPLVYLNACNTALGTVITDIGTDYGTEITAINADIQIPTEKAACKAQKKNKQDMEAKKELVEEGA